ncbi:MAG: hypothetical protein ACXWQ5_00445 [Ktedonobacterales bacterium]
MRKNYKDKRRACKLCYPHKRGFVSRWKPKEREKMVRTEKALRERQYDEQ